MSDTVKHKKELPALKRLKTLIEKLSKEEIETAFAYLNAFDVAKNETKTSMLLRYILENRGVSAAVAAEHFGIRRMRTFDTLVNRLREKLAYVLTLEVNYMREGINSPASRAYYGMLDDLKKIFTFTGARHHNDKETRHEMAQAIKKGKTFEHYGFLVEVLDLKLHFEELREPDKSHAELINEIEHYEKCRDALRKTKRWYNEYRKYYLIDGFRTGFKEKFSPILERLAQLQAETESKTIQYFYYVMKLGYLQEDRNFKLANEYAMMILNLVMDSKVVNTRPRMGIAHMHVSDTYLYQLQLENAIHAAQASQNYIAPGSWNYYQSEELEFWSMFYQGKYIPAEQKVLAILNNKRYRQSALFDSKMEYFHACVMFAMGKFNKCKKLIKEVNEIKTDKAGWNIGLRILSIMISVMERNKAASFEKYDALRKHIHNVKQYKHVRDRELLIVKILKDLIKEDFSFSKTYTNRQKEFELLLSGHAECGWQVKSHELIIFPVWFECMMKGVPYFLDISLVDHHTVQAV